MYAILATLIENSNEAAQGRLAACLGRHCPMRCECAVALKVEANGISANPPMCPVNVELLAILWDVIAKEVQ